MLLLVFRWRVDNPQPTLINFTARKIHNTEYIYFVYGLHLKKKMFLLCYIYFKVISTYRSTCTIVRF